MIKSLLLTAARVCTFEQQRLLTNASRFFSRARLMRTRIATLLSLIALAIGSVSPTLAQSLTSQRFVLPTKRDWTDFSAMLKRRTLRILVPYSKTLFFVDRGRQMGVVAEFGRALEDWINARYKFKTLRFGVTFLPVPPRLSLARLRTSADARFACAVPAAMRTISLGSAMRSWPEA
jgi:hypothetical protein